MRVVNILVLRPSRDLGKLSSEYEALLPGFFRFLTRGLGTRQTASPDILSLLMFQADYLGRLIELGEEDAQDLAKNSHGLHLLPEFRAWFPPKQALDELLLKLGERLTPGAEPNPEELQKSLEEEVVAATDRYFTPERREVLSRVMKDSALSVLSREGEVRTLEVVATMKNIRDAGLITNPPHEVGFLRGFFDKAISAMAYQDGGRLRIPVPRPADASTPASV